MSFSLCSNPISPLKLRRMASAMLSRRISVVAAANLKGASTRRFFCSLTPAERLHPHMQKIGLSISPSLVSLATFFSSDGKIHHSCRGGTGVFLDPKLIVTSAHVVGHVSTSYESARTVEKSDRFDKGSIIHTSCIGTTSAFTSYGETLMTKPLAVNFTNDVAVLELVSHQGHWPCQCALVSSPPVKENIVMAMAHEQDFRFMAIMGNVRAVGCKTIKAKAPWPRDDEHGWIEHDWFFYGGNAPPPGSILSSTVEKVTGSITRIPGGPWFNLNGEVVGISSWEVVDRVSFSVGFAVPPSTIRAVLDYAKTKGPEDPIVMDRWIDVMTSV